MFSLTDEQLHAMWAACSEIAAEPDAAQACRRLSERLSEIIKAPTPIFRRDVSPWRLVPTSSATDRPPETLARTLEELVPAPNIPHLPIVTHGDQSWTPLLLEDERPLQSMLLLPGDWRSGPSAPWLPRFARTASIALRLAASRQAARMGEELATAAYAFARKLNEIRGDRVVHQFIVDAAARTTHARLAGLSVYRANEGAIAVSATHGYPTEAVTHVRIVPGSGIIGGVFSSKKPLLVRDSTRVPGLARKSERYQTGSFMAVPIVAGDESLGVVTLADRSDGNPFTRHDLAAARVITALSSLALVREQLTRLSDQLAHAAAIDPLTGMFNRRYLEGRLEAELEGSRRTGLPVGLLMIDVDNFKRVNDRLGHQTGDVVLRKAAEIIRRTVRASDVCTRFGGDEFAVIVTENAPSAFLTAERIRSRLQSFRWESLGLPVGLRVTASVGCALGEVGESADSLIGRADREMYRAKALGRNRVMAAEG